MLDFNKIIGITQFQRNIKKNIDTMLESGNSLILTRDSKPEAVISSFKEYQRLKQAEEQLKREQFGKLVDSIRTRNKNIPEEELERDIKMAEKEAKSKYYANRS